MSRATEQAPQVQTIDRKEHENEVKEAQKNGNEKAVGHKDGHGHHDVKEEVQLYALENAFSWPVSLVMGLNHNDHHHHHSHSSPKHEKHEEKEVQYAVENAFSWPVSLVMHLIHENQGQRGAKAGNSKKGGSQGLENVEGAKSTLMGTNQ